MEKGSREQNIKQIITMEDRIGQCSRCSSLSRCMRKPSLGKGDLEPNVMLVFECDSHFTLEIERLIHLRNLIKKYFETDKVYHTFLVRCQPKACTDRQSASCYVEGKLLDKEKNCILTGRQCSGIPIKPSAEEIMSCMPFLLEEVNILKPDYVVLFGERVSSFVIKSCGIYDPVEMNKVYDYNGVRYITNSQETAFAEDLAKDLTLLRD